MDYDKATAEVERLSNITSVAQIAAADREVAKITALALVDIARSLSAPQAALEEYATGKVEELLDPRVVTLIANGESITRPDGSFIAIVLNDLDTVTRDGLASHIMNAPGETPPEDPDAPTYLPVDDDTLPFTYVYDEEGTRRGYLTTVDGESEGESWVQVIDDAGLSHRIFVRVLKYRADVEELYVPGKKKKGKK